MNRAANDLAIATNPQAFFWGSDENGQPMVIDEVKRIAALEKIKDAIAEQLEGRRFADWVNADVLFIE